MLKLTLSVRCIPRHIGTVGMMALFCALVGGAVAAEKERAVEPLFDTERDLISLHYDHAPDKDDGQSAAADRMILQSLFGLSWMKEHTVAVSGAYGENADRFNERSDAVMDAVFADAGGWIDGHQDGEKAIEALTKRWRAVLEAGGDVWVKEGGQSDLTAEVVKHLQNVMPDLETRKRVHVVQHSNWNERQTTDEALQYVKGHSDYIRIQDANRFLNIKGGDRAFERAATMHPTFGKAWQAAFDYYDPRHRLDFSDTGELLHMLGLGEPSIDAIRRRFLEPEQ